MIEIKMQVAGMFPGQIQNYENGFRLIGQRRLVGILFELP